MPAQQLEFLSGDLRDFIEGLSIAKRRAVLVALFMDMTEGQVVSLRWRDLKGMQLDHFSSAIIGACRVNPNLEYVFWENLTDDVTGPLFGLDDSLWESSGGYRLEELRELFKRMKWHDTEAELTSVRAAVPGVVH